ncbi:hypothetical protein DWQ65_07170 [Treponema phagedenis]|uniref:Uncharacterized protein n=1 Tax=Treponema phagedenis TaxID=162 RepID=A0A0B7H030_TREPH|nr:hypothetical protein FUT79_06515 [Treponema phagedenis]QEJ97880.1 hypothetical protein FUT82_07650 [Treponema phagedenis]QEK00796.1 hypothetical protein FUT84_06175 [Treponema phagedenis]QEK03447.1 hypothetical protein FUT83_06265 [Treponema phagedenis]QEK05803.1 hypothetical protein FUT80_03090 [Treponema phagedenis]
MIEMKNNHSEDAAFIAALEYILNKASIKEIDAFEEAVQRRKRSFESFPGLRSLNPEEMAKKMSSSIQKSIDASMLGVRNTVRNFAADMLAKEAPELSQEQLENLLDSWIPEAPSYTAEGGTVRHSIAKAGKVNGIPADALYGMILQFVSYSIGEMSKEELKELQESMGDWTGVYWKRFPADIQREIKSFLQGEINSGQFRKSIQALLGLA